MLAPLRVIASRIAPTLDTLALALTLAACRGISLSEADWRPPASGAGPWVKDAYECEYGAQVVYPQATIGNVEQDMAEKCLRARGYTKVTQ